MQSDDKPSKLQLLSESFFGDSGKIFWLIPVTGVAGGLTALVFLKLLALFDHFLSPALRHPVQLVVTMALVGLAVGLISHFLGNPGDVELLVNNIHLLGGHKDIRSLRSLIPISLLCISAGGAAGPEAPLVQTTGSLGSWIAYRKNLSKNELRILTITGMAAGFTVLFGAPLGAAIFALEILHRRGLEYYEALVPALVGSVCGYAFFTLATGTGLAPTWAFPPFTAIREADIAWSVVVGLLAVLVAIAFTYFNKGARALFHKIHPIVRPAVGGMVLAGLGLLSGYALTFGEHQIGEVVFLPLTLSALLIAAAAKFVGTSVTVSSGWKGGFIIPLFFIGLALARALHGIFPGTNEVMLIAAAMAAVNTGVTKTPIGSTLVVTEMAGLQLLPTTLIACLVTLLLTSNVGMIHTQQQRDDVAD